MKTKTRLLASHCDWFPSASLAPLLNNTHTMFLILLARDPHLVEGAQASENASSDPGAESSLARQAGSVDLDLHAWLHGDELVVQAIVEAVEQGGAAGDNHVAEQVRP